MDIALLRTFLAVHRAGSLTAAAPRLGLSQPAVTAQLRALEAQLGQQLFQRQARGVRPTPVADELARQVADHLDALEAVTCRRLEHHDPFARPVQFGGPAEFTAELVLPALAPLVSQGLKLRVTTGLSDDLLAGLTAGRLDLVLSTVRPRGRALTATPLTDEEFVLVGAPTWAERIDPDRLATAGPAALSEVPLVAYGEDLPVIRRYWRTQFGRHPTGTAAIVVPDLRAVLTAVLAGAGVSVLPRYLCRHALATGHLVPLIDPEVPPINTLYLATRAAGTPPAAVTTVRDTLLAAAPTW